VGFEPTEGCPSNDFESFAFDHSATSPGNSNTLMTEGAVHAWHQPLLEPAGGEQRRATGHASKLR
jgi:hypothetical protein